MDLILPANAKSSKLQMTQEASSLKQLYEPPTLIHLFQGGQWTEIDSKLEAIFDELEKERGLSHEHTNAFKKYKIDDFPYINSSIQHIY